MRYISLFSGIEAATVAWEPLGFQPVAFSEFAPFPSAVLAHRYPHVPNLGDITRIDWSDLHGAADLIVGGSPCQSFSVAGLRKGLMDTRGSLMLEYLGAVAAVRPKWTLWENVPGVLSIDAGRAFATLGRGLEELGYGFAYRVLDAQYFGVAQRRRRVFVVGYLGDWRPPAAVLFERTSLRGDTPPRREPRASAAGEVEGRATYTINANIIGRERKTMHGLGIGTLDVMDTLTSSDIHAVAAFSAGQSAGAGSLGYAEEVAPTLRAGGSGTNQVPAVLAFSPNASCTRGIAEAEELAPTLRSGGGGGAITPAVCMADDNGKAAVDTELAGSLKAGGSAPMVATDHVRRLTPRECERLQGFPDDYTLVPYRGKPATDTVRYKALGNSMAVPVMRWIGGRIREVDDYLRLGAERMKNR